MNTCPKCGGALLFQYDLARIKERLSKEVFDEREDTFWSFIELLPISSSDAIVSLGEPYTPVLRFSPDHCTNYGEVYLKDDGRLPTGTFKARVMAVAVSKLRELGVKRIAVPSAGNAAAALAAYGARAGLHTFAFMPRDTSQFIQKECLLAGAKVYLVDGLINRAAEIVKKLKGRYRWFDISTNKQPYRVEGCKTMAFEIAEQFGWIPPDHIVFPTGGGEGIIGLWKGFGELYELGWVDKIPRLTIIQSSGCAPLVKAYNENQLEVQEPCKNARTIATGLRVPNPYASYLVLQAINETRGAAVAVEDADIVSSMKAFFKKGIYACPEAASTLAGLEKLIDESTVNQDDVILLYLTGTAMKYFDIIPVGSMPARIKGAEESLKNEKELDI